MKTVSITYKFNLGDAVVTRNSVQECVGMNLNLHTLKVAHARYPAYLFVAERHSIEGPSGTQLLYLVQNKNQMYRVCEENLMVASEGLQWCLDAIPADAAPIAGRG